MARRDYICCKSCGNKLVYDGYDNIRESLDFNYGTVDLICPSCLDALEVKLAKLEQATAVEPAHKYTSVYAGNVVGIYKDGEQMTIEQIVSDLNTKAVEPAQAVPVAWSKMDYNNLPPEGVYWVVLQSPEYVCDIDDSGNPIGVPTGKTSRRILLAHIEHELQPRADVSSDDYECYPVALSVDRSCKDMQDDEHITHYATPVKPTAQLDSDTRKMALELCRLIIDKAGPDSMITRAMAQKAEKISERLEAGE